MAIFYPTPTGTFTHPPVGFNGPINPMYRMLGAVAPAEVPAAPASSISSMFSMPVFGGQTLGMVLLYAVGAYFFYRIFLRSRVSKLHSRSARKHRLQAQVAEGKAGLKGLPLLG